MRNAAGGCVIGQVRHLGAVPCGLGGTVDIPQRQVRRHCLADFGGARRQGAVRGLRRDSAGRGGVVWPRLKQTDLAPARSGGGCSRS
eukprot:1470437-Pyramimonas_sp.AAC.1